MVLLLQTVWWKLAFNFQRRRLVNYFQLFCGPALSWKEGMYDNGLVLDIPIIRKTTCRFSVLSLSFLLTTSFDPSLSHTHTIKQTRNKGVCLLRGEFEQKNGVLEHGRGPQENQRLPQPLLRRRFGPGRGFPQAAPLSLIQQPRYPLSRRCPQRLPGHAFT